MQNPNEFQEPGAQAPGNDAGAMQDSYLPADVPSGYVNPPSGSVFANATWMHAGPEVVRIVQKVLGFEEFEDIAHLPFTVTWRRNTNPYRSDGSFVLAGVVLTDPRVLWELHQQEITDFPRYSVDLNWQHFENMRSGKGEDGKGKDGGAEFIHSAILAREVHAALCSIGISNDILRRIPADVQVYSATVRRFGEYTEGARTFRQQANLFESEDAAKRPLDYLAQD